MITFEEINVALGFELIKNWMASIKCSCNARIQFPACFLDFGVYCRECGNFLDMRDLLGDIKFQSEMRP